MALVLADDTAAAMNVALRDAVNAGSTNPEAQFLVQDGNGDTLCAIPLDEPDAFNAYDPAEPRQLELNVPRSAAAAVGGTAAQFVVVDRDDAEVYRGVISGIGGGGDAVIDSIAIGAGDTVQIIEHVILAPGA